MREEKEFWIDSEGVKRLLPSPKYPLRKTTLGRLLYDYIVEQNGNACRICGDPSNPLNVDHIIPRKYGGTHHPRNLQAVCGPCNSRKTWFDRTPFKIIDSVKLALSAIDDESGGRLLEVLLHLRDARIVNKDSVKRVTLLINSGIISGSYNVR